MSLPINHQIFINEIKKGKVTISQRFNHYYTPDEKEQLYKELRIYLVNYVTISNHNMKNPQKRIALPDHNIFRMHFIPKSNSTNGRNQVFIDLKNRQL